MNLADDMRDDRIRRMVNQRAFRDYFVDCLCDRGCALCAYTGLVSKGQAKLALAVGEELGGP
jgi:hypothetical protein